MPVRLQKKIYPLPLRAGGEICCFTMGVAEIVRGQVLRAQRMPATFVRLAPCSRVKFGEYRG